METLFFENKERDYAQELFSEAKKELVNNILNSEIDADYKEREKDIHGHGKRIPYIGWYWRNIDFFNNNVCIGDCGKFIGIMQNNKWGYPERVLTEQEYKILLKYLYAIRSWKLGHGDINDNYKKSEVICNQLWDWMQTLEV